MIYEAAALGPTVSGTARQERSGLALYNSQPARPPYTGEEILAQDTEPARPSRRALQDSPFRMPRRDSMIPVSQQQVAGLAHGARCYFECQSIRTIGKSQRRSSSPESRVR